MRQVYPEIQPENVVVSYAWSGLGFAGDPNGPDVAPLTTVGLQNMQFAAFATIFTGANLELPSFSYSLPMEDGSGANSN